MRHEAILRIPVSDRELARAFLAALLPEAEEPPTDRLRAEVRLEGRVLVITMQASDTSSLRAGLNSYMSWLKAVENACSVAEKAERPLRGSDRPV